MREKRLLLNAPNLYRDAMPRIGHPRSKAETEAEYKMRANRRVAVMCRRRRVRYWRRLAGLHPELEKLFRPAQHALAGRWQRGKSQRVCPESTSFF